MEALMAMHHHCMPLAHSLEDVPEAQLEAGIASPFVANRNVDRCNVATRLEAAVASHVQIPPASVHRETVALSCAWL